jgi:hypothetical protein
MSRNKFFSVSIVTCFTFYIYLWPMDWLSLVWRPPNELKFSWIFLRCRQPDVSCLRSHGGVNTAPTVLHLATLSLAELYTYSIAWYGDRLMMNWKGSGRKLSWPNQSTTPKFSWNKWDSYNDVIKICRCPGGDSNWEPPEYNSRSLPLRKPARTEHYHLLGWDPL